MCFSGMARYALGDSMSQYRHFLPLAAGAVGLALVAYTTSRAALTSFTHDESITYLVHVQRSVGQIIQFDVAYASNNHVLNTLLMKVSAWLFGTNELALRLPALLAHVGFLLGTYVATRPLARPWLRGATFLVLNTNPYVLDMFSCARGYALALCFTAWTLHFVLRAAASRSALWRPAGAAVACATLAVLSQFAYLHVFVATLACLFGLACLAAIVPADPADERFRWRELEQVTLCLMTGVLAVNLLAGRHIVLIRRFGDLTIDMMRGEVLAEPATFFHRTIQSIAWISMYYEDLALVRPIAWAVVGLVACACGAAWHDARRRGDRVPAMLIVFLALLWLGVEAQHRLFGTGYLVGRTALYFWPALGLVVGFLVRNLPPRAGVALASLLVLGSVTNLGRAANLERHVEWTYDAATRTMVDDLTRLRPEERVRLGNHWLFEPTINFYRVTRGLSWLDEVDREGLFARPANALYYFPERLSPEDKTELASRPLVVTNYAISGTALAVPSRTISHVATPSPPAR